MIDKLRLRETIIVEGRYDKIKLSECIASPIIETGGFRVFKDKEKQALIRAVANRRGILVMTDVDSAGFVIRNFLRGIVPREKLLHAYIPTIEGKEKRKSETSKEGILGVEGIDREALIQAIKQSGAHLEEDRTIEIESDHADSGLSDGSGKTKESVDTSITKTDFYDYGMSGTENAAQNRERVLSALGLPRYLTANAMLSAINALFTKEEFEDFLLQLY
ncbi:toprim domain-containing protein [Ruminococcus sp.]|uniref:toprim domain-containing protein n=1 Tax=Ruminococcus sp. TaxID=41978 RepID=UPI003890D329